MKSKIAAALIAAVTLGTVAVASSSQAQAHWHGRGWGAIGLGLAAGALISEAATADDVYVPRCHWARQYDRRGNYIGNAKVCDY
jgi:hypothetical protein